jgi:hypothetical protein
MEMPAVKTTIVGGRPPGCGKMLGEIPRGIEVLVKKASVDPAFRAMLLERRSKAAAEIGLKLAPAEAMMLDHVPLAQLEAIINRTRVDPSRRNAFLSKAAGVMLAALGASASLSEADVALSKGIRVDPNANAPVATQPATQPSTRPSTEPISRGVRPDVPVMRDVAGLTATVSDSQPAATDQPAPPPRIVPQRPIMRVAGNVIGPINEAPDPLPAPSTTSAPARTQPASQPIPPDNMVPVAGTRPPAPPPPAPAVQPLAPDKPMLVAGARAVSPGDEAPASTPASQPTSSTQPALTPAEYDALVTQLADANYATREAAQKTLMDQGVRILPALRTTLQNDKLDVEARSRLETIVSKLAATTKPTRPKDITARRGMTVAE